MQTAEEQAVAEAADQQQVEAEVSEADEEMPIAEAAPSPAPEQPAAAAPARLQSKVVVPSPHNYDPRCASQSQIQGREVVVYECAGSWGSTMVLSTWLPACVPACTVPTPPRLHETAAC